MLGFITKFRPDFEAKLAMSEKAKAHKAAGAPAAGVVKLAVHP